MLCLLMLSLSVDIGGFIEVGNVLYVAFFVS